MRTPVAFGVTFAAFGSGLFLGTQVALAAYAAGSDPYSGLETFARALTQIQVNHVEEHDTRELVWAAVDGMAEHLDAHTMFFDPDAYQQLLADHEDRYFGVGIEALPVKGGGALITGVISDSPAQLAGVLVDDVIERVDGEAIRGWEFRTVVASIKGERGTEVDLGLLRGEDRLTVTVVRDEIPNPSARGELVEPGLAYIRLSHFRRGASDELRETLDELGRDAPLQAAVLDMRGNPGGLLEEAVAIVDTFVGDALVVSTRGRKAGADEDLRATDDSDDRLEIRLLVLVDGDSASASEIVAGALQDLDRAELVGQTTYGKGSVQSVYEYDDGSALKLTVSRYELPGGRVIEVDGGLLPDIEVAPAEGDRMRVHLSVADRVERDAQLAKALELARTP